MSHPTGADKNDRDNTDQASNDAGPTAATTKQTNGSVRTKEFADVFKEEGKRLHHRQKVGLALSGGGIRSASFAMGVLQGFKKMKKKLDAIDYVSTVSGGGYTGSSLTYFLRKGLPEERGGTFTYGPREFPFGEAYKGTKKDQSDKNVVLNFVRQHGRYLIPGDGLSPISLFAVIVRGMIISLGVYLSLVTLVLIGLVKLRVFQDMGPGHPVWELSRLLLSVPNLLLWVAVATGVIVIAAALVFSVRIPRVRGFFDRYKERIRDQKMLGRIWTIGLGIAVLGSLAPVAGSLDTVVKQVLAATGLTSIGSVLGVFQFQRGQSAEVADTGWMAKLRIYAGAMALLYGLLLSGYLLANWIVAKETWIWWSAGIAAGAAVVGLVADLNLAGLHRMYRNRLMETFMPNPQPAVTNMWGPATCADEMPISDVCDAEVPRPYHLVNTNLVLVDAEKAKFRGRGGDNFVFSPLYCGSSATGWIQTRRYTLGDADPGMTLATAMAISGAAVNPNAGVAGKGVTRSRFVSMLLSLLNLRLGYWAQNPGLASRPWYTANYFRPNLWGGVFGRGLDETATWIELSDGGHFENLGLYELIRRELTTIIACDAGADPDFKFADLGTAIERVRVDFGVKISFDERTNTGLKGVTPGSAMQDGLLPKSQLAVRGYAIGTITYPTIDKATNQQLEGTLIYLKTTLPQDLPVDLYQYKRKHPEFPDQSTADQFFDEDQFEAYRELGYRISKQMLTDNAQHGWWK